MLKNSQKLFYRLFVLVLMLCVLKVHAEMKQPMVTVKMRDHGYTMGDFIVQNVQIQLPQNQTIDPQSLPLAGYVSPWLDLSKVTFNQENQLVTLVLNWQIFATVEFTQGLKIPEMTLKTNGKNPQKIIIPAQSFYYSSVLPQSVADIKRRPNLPPLLFDTFSPMLAACGFALLAILGFLCWCWLQDKISWLPYAAGPMTTLARKLKGKSVIELHHANLLYQALNQCAGKNIYLNNQAELFEKAAYLKPYQAQIQQCLQAANQLIYQHQSLGIAHAQQQIQDFGASGWILEAARAERIFRRQSRRQNNV
jgi:hypothetical protein